MKDLGLEELDELGDRREKTKYRIVGDKEGGWFFYLEYLDTIIDVKGTWWNKVTSILKMWRRIEGVPFLLFPGAPPYIAGNKNALERFANQWPYIEDYFEKRKKELEQFKKVKEEFDREEDERRNTVKNTTIYL